MIFQISDLNALGRAPQTGDVFAIDTGTDTAKIDYNALATAIINKIAKYMYCDTDNKQTFTFDNLSLLDNTGKYKYGLLFGGEQTAPFVYHVFAAVDNTITITPILSNSNSVTFTGSVSGTTLTLTGDKVAYGGVRLIWINA